MADFSSRVEREREKYDEGLKRQSYNRLLVSHARHWYTQERRRIAKDLLEERRMDRVLEVGRTLWYNFLETNGIYSPDVTCINISDKELSIGRKQSEDTTIKPRFVLMDAHSLKFPDNHFDLVFGTGILHHLELDIALAELRRVLRPDGLFMFCEPLDNNPTGRVIRRLTPNARTVDEKPLRFRDLALIDKYFDCTHHYEQLLSVPAGIVSKLVFRRPDNPLTHAAFRSDQALLRRVPRLGPYYRNVTLVGTSRP